MTQTQRVPWVHSCSRCCWLPQPQAALNLLPGREGPQPLLQPAPCCRPLLWDKLSECFHPLGPAQTQRGPEASSVHILSSLMSRTEKLPGLARSRQPHLYSGNEKSQRHKKPPMAVHYGNPAALQNPQQPAHNLAVLPLGQGLQPSAGAALLPVCAVHLEQD